MLKNPKRDFIMEIREAVIKNMDHLGLIAGMVDELKIAKNVDEALPSSTQTKNLNYGESVKAMIIPKLIFKLTSFSIKNNGKF